MQAEEELSSQCFSEETDNNGGVDKNSRSDILCSVKQTEEEKQRNKDEITAWRDTRSCCGAKNNCIRHITPNECEQVETPVRESENIELDSFNHF